MEARRTNSSMITIIFDRHCSVWKYVEERESKVLCSVFFLLPSRLLLEESHAPNWDTQQLAIDYMLQINTSTDWLRPLGTGVGFAYFLARGKNTYKAFFVF